MSCARNSIELHLPLVTSRTPVLARTLRVRVGSAHLLHSPLSSAPLSRDGGHYLMSFVSSL